MKKETKDLIMTICAILIIVTLLFTVTQLMIKDYQIEKKLETGKILTVQLLNACITYYSNTGLYIINDRASYNEYYPFDARKNPYFSTFSTYPTKDAKQAISVFGSGEMEKYELRVIFDKDTKIKGIKDIHIQTLTNE